MRMMECLELPVATSRVDNSSISSFYDILYIFVVLSTKYPKTINYANTCNNGRLAQAIERPTLHPPKKALGFVPKNGGPGYFPHALYWK